MEIFNSGESINFLLPFLPQGSQREKHKVHKETIIPSCPLCITLCTLWLNFF